jgi:hypothetical protein
MRLTNPKKKYAQLYKEMFLLCSEQGWGNPFLAARSKEILTACQLGHSVADTYSGCDAINQHGQEVEYKSTIDKKVKGSYTGISVQSTWKEQVLYLKEEKILKYPEHFFNRFENGELVESWKLTGQQVYDILLPKLKKAYPSVLSKKDPRLAANVTNSDIEKYGIKVL